MARGSFGSLTDKIEPPVWIPANRKRIVTIALVAVGLAGLLAMFAASRWRLPQIGAVGFALFVVAFACFGLSVISVWFERVGGARWRVPGAAAFASILGAEVGAQVAERSGFPMASARLDALAEMLARVFGFGVFALFAWRFVQAIQRQRRSDGRGVRRE